MFLTLSLIYEGHKYSRTRARPLSRKQMWEPRALGLFQVIILGCGPALHLMVRSSFLGCVQSRVATWSRATERSFPSLPCGSCRSHSPCSNPGDLLCWLWSVHKWSFKIMYLFFISPIIVCEICRTQTMFKKLGWQNLVTVIFGKCFEQC